ncbi:MAG: zinc-ribbon domain-containing protein, partial [Euryarchaeota archaeon]|nr:zinc-ribbon domain-containing protein [Euryarchaeota archaeon]
MYCTKCGTQNSDDTSFCSKCGSNFKYIKPEIDRSGITGELGKAGIPG